MGDGRPVPDVLVLAAGGIVGEAWMTGVLAGIEDAHGVDFRRVEQLIGTSAGAIVAAVLAAGIAPRRPAEVDRPDRVAPRRSGADGPVGLGLRALARAAVPIVAASAPVGAAARAFAVSRIGGGDRSLDELRTAPELAGARFDGRLRVVAVDRDRGRRVVFGAPGEPAPPPREAIAASCAVPGIFAPIVIDGRPYVDGGVWSPTNLDVAVAGRDTHVLCLSVLGALPLRDTPPAMAAIRLGARAGAAVEAEALRRRGATVELIAPDAAAVAAIGGQLMDRARVGDVLAAGYRQGRALPAMG